MLWRVTVLLMLGLGASHSAAQSPAMQRDSRRDCAVCHLGWVDAFERAQADLLIARPDGEVAAEGTTCLGCHDGSVADSRREVWLEHGHQTGIRPPQDMRVPELLPLDDGKITCRTCHSAHAAAGVETLETAVFVRVPNEASQLCQMCHPEKTKGPELGTHPVGGMPWPVPEQLLAAGARVGPAEYRLICQTCHTPHGAREDHLLVMGTESSQLCLTCHEKLRPGLWRPDLQREHPQNPPLRSDAQRHAIREMGTKTGPNDTLICLSCHKLHQGLAGRDMLADTLEDSRLCIRCHPERVNVLDSDHDLRKSAPDERNRLGLTADESGPCGACHSFHQFARRPETRPFDPTGLCFTCHQSGQCAEQASGQPFSHPVDAPAGSLPGHTGLDLYPAIDGGSTKVLACLTCHDPHETQQAHFLRLESDSLCARCHVGQAKALAGGHDFTSKPAARNGRDLTAAQSGRCGFCHVVHDANGPAMWAATATPPSDPDDLCVQCHKPDGLASAKPKTKFRHPTGPRKDTFDVEANPGLPLFAADGRRIQGGSVACSSCHDPHADPSERPALLRVAAPTSRLCSTCHRSQAGLAGGLHDPAQAPGAWPEASRQKIDLCMSCHLAHGDDPSRQLWTVAPQPKFTVSDGACLACHQHAEWAGHGAELEPGAALHPRMVTGEVRVRDLPLIPSGEGRVPDVIGCKTCHDPHAPPTGPAHILREGTSRDPASMCMRCHEDVQYIGVSLHSQGILNRRGDDTQVCGPCHVVHAKSGTSESAMWAAPAGPASDPPDVRRCMGCHGERGAATRVDMIHHPAAALQNVDSPGSVSFMPLVNEEGAISDHGRIGCITCHMTHGRPPAGGFPVIDPDSVTREQLHVMMPMLRPYVAPNLCSSCHGFDGLRRFLYFHHPNKRRSPMTLPSLRKPSANSNSVDGSGPPMVRADGLRCPAAVHCRGG